MSKDEALKMAIEALNTLMMEKGSVYQKAIQACKEALAQPAQEPNLLTIAYMSGVAQGESKKTKQPAQKPFGYFTALPFGWTDCGKDDEGAIALYEHPAPSWQKLSDDEIEAISDSVRVDGIMTKKPTWYKRFARAIEQALKEKNHGN